MSGLYLHSSRIHVSLTVSELQDRYIVRQVNVAINPLYVCCKLAVVVHMIFFISSMINTVVIVVGACVLYSTVECKVIRGEKLCGYPILKVKHGVHSNSNCSVSLYSKCFVLFLAP